jgi:hypothetical protein
LRKSAAAVAVAGESFRKGRAQLARFEIRRYFSGEPLELFEEVLQVARDGLDDQMLDADGGVPVDLLDDLA